MVAPSNFGSPAQGSSLLRDRHAQVVRDGVVVHDVETDLLAERFAAVAAASRDQRPPGAAVGVRTLGAEIAIGRTDARSEYGSHHS